MNEIINDGFIYLAAPQTMHDHFVLNKNIIEIAVSQNNKNKLFVQIVNRLSLSSVILQCQKIGLKTTNPLNLKGNF